MAASCSFFTPISALKLCPHHKGLDSNTPLVAYWVYLTERHKNATEPRGKMLPATFWDFFVKTTDNIMKNIRTLKVMDQDIEKAS